MSGKLLRTFRLDATDSRVFDHAAEPGEWAVPGTFAFLNDDPGTLTGKARQAFRHGFLGLGSFGRSTLAIVVDANDQDRGAVVDALAVHLLTAYGAPDLDAASAFAAGELAFAAELADFPVNTLVALEREPTEGGVHERFTKFEPGRETDHARIWEVSDAEG